jgi:membrane protein DedA with SNARE-associated domain
MPGSNIVCALVGYRRMPVKTFVACLSAGIAFRLAWVWLAAKQFEDQLKTALSWIERYQWPLVVAFLVVTFAQSMRKAAKSRPEADAALEHVVEAIVDDDPPGSR